MIYKLDSSGLSPGVNLLEKTYTNGTCTSILSLNVTPKFIRLRLCAIHSLVRMLIVWRLKFDHNVQHTIYLPVINWWQVWIKLSCGEMIQLQDNRHESSNMSDKPNLLLALFLRLGCAGIPIATLRWLLLRRMRYSWSHILTAVLIIVLFSVHLLVDCINLRYVQLTLKWHTISHLCN